MKYAVIVNPNSSSGKTRNMIPDLDSGLKKRNIDFEIFTTSREREAIELTQKAIANHFDAVVAVGGDGTLHEVLNGIGDSPVHMGIIPAGTGNDFVRPWNWSKNLEEGLDRLERAKAKKIDMAKADDKYFINSCSIAFDALVIKEANKMRANGFSSLAYSLALMKSFVKYKHMPVALDGKKEREVFLLSLMNGQYYGGGFGIAPKAQINDGLLDFIHIDGVSKWTVARKLPKIINGSHLDDQIVHYEQRESLSFSSSQDFYLNLDGELYFYPKQSKIKIQILPNALSLLV